LFAGCTLAISPSLINTAALGATLTLAVYLAHRAFHAPPSVAVRPAPLLGAWAPTIERSRT
jgi:hypothetical protein